MTSQKVSWRGVSVEITVPDRLVGRLWRGGGRGAATDGLGRLVFRHPPPALNVVRRDPSRGLDFFGTSRANDRRSVEEAELPTSDDLADRVQSTTWYHTIELPGGITTPGQFDHRSLVSRYGIPTDLSGKRALDVATFNGFWAFELERRGADVTAIDLDDPHGYDYPAAVRKIADSFPEMGPINEGFHIAHAALNSSVKRLNCSVYDLDPETVGTFDFVHCGDLLVHLRDPLRALERMRSVTTGQLLLCDGIDVHASAGQWGPTTQYLGGWEDVIWWIPSLDALAQMVIDAGFRDVRVNCVYDLAKRYETSGIWRASLTATV